MTDRGVDFFYMEDEQKKYLNIFFEQYFEPHYEQQGQNLGLEEPA